MNDVQLKTITATADDVAHSHVTIAFTGSDPSPVLAEFHRYMTAKGLSVAYECDGMSDSEFTAWLKKNVFDPYAISGSYSIIWKLWHG